MPSDLDRRLDAMVCRITGEGGVLETRADAAGRAICADLPATLPAFFDHFCAIHGDARHIVMGDERIGFAAMNGLADRAARALAGRFGIAKGDRVAIAMRNAPAWIALYMAVLKAGGIAVLINGWWQADELRAAIGIAEPKLILADEDRAARCAAGNFAVPVVTIALERPLAETLAETLAPLLDGDDGIATLPVMSPEDDATMLFTSGSTGAARGAVSTHRAVTTGTYVFLTYTASLYELLKGDGIPADYVPATLIAVPLFHVTGEVPVLLNSFATGRKIVLMRKWDAGEALRLIEAERVSYFVGVPTMSMELMAHPDRPRRNISTLMDLVAGGAARPVAHVEPLAAAFPHAHPMMGYGLTETNAVGCNNLRSNYRAKPASTGRAQAPFVEVTILDPGDAKLAAGAQGEIAIRSAANFRCYWRDPAATAAAITADGYFRTGDLGYLDEDGYLFIVDRAKDIIIRGGENISCQEVEAALYAHPAVAEACVFGLPDERLGETPGAVIHLKRGITLGTSELRDFAGERLARFKLPHMIWFEDGPLPRLGTGKIDKKRLRARYHALLANSA